VPRLFELPTALLEYLDLLQRGCNPLPLTYMIMFKIIVKYTISYYWRRTHAYYIETIAPRAHLRIYRLKEDTSLPAIFNPLCSSTSEELFKSF